MSLLFWVTLINVTLLILHEMDSAYWKEWELFHLPGGLTGFLLIHFPLYILGLYGLVEVSRDSAAGMIYALIIALAGIGAFGIHAYFLRKGLPQFNTAFSKILLWSLLFVSIFQCSIAFIFSGK
jgi:hypothetical protein